MTVARHWETFTLSGRQNIDNQLQCGGAQPEGRDPVGGHI